MEVMAVRAAAQSSSWTEVAGVELRVCIPSQCKMYSNNELQEIPSWFVNKVGTIRAHPPKCDI